LIHREKGNEEDLPADVVDFLVWPATLEELRATPIALEPTTKGMSTTPPYLQELLSGRLSRMVRHPFSFLSYLQ
jgi:hypothetical protein